MRMYRTSSFRRMISSDMFLRRCGFLSYVRERVRVGIAKICDVESKNQKLLFVGWKTVMTDNSVVETVQVFAFGTRIDCDVCVVDVIGISVGCE